jgi:NDP-sugar pyrophosphorylase family protein
MIEHQVAALAEAGVTDIVLAVNYRPEVMTKELQKVRWKIPQITVYLLISISLLYLV